LENLPEKAEWLSQVKGKRESFKLVVEESLRAKDSSLPSDSEVLGGVRAALPKDGTIVCAAGGLPGELHKVWPSSGPGTYHVEYGYSCMGYEIAGGLGVKMAHPEREVCVVVGDGSYLMLNSEIATSVMLGKKLIIVVLDNGGFGCINRLQNACGSESFLNRFDDCHFEESHPEVDFVAHAKSLGADGEFVDGIRELSSALIRARESQKTYVISLKTDPFTTTGSGGHWWEVTPTENPETEKQKIVSRQYNEMVDSRI
jgi:3D-(3,5/4)-trihydroxycyclohexane-1,2-dione acylhydrolase (decyclizing)